MALAQILPVVSGDTSLPAFDPAVLKAMGIHIPEFVETGLDADYLFDGPDAGLRSRISPHVLDATGKSVSFKNDAAGRYLEIAPDGLNGLLTPTVDSEDIFYAGVLNWREPLPADVYRYYAGTASGTSNAGGEMLLSSPTGGINVNVRGLSSQVGISYGTLTAAGAVPGDNTWLFVAKTVYGAGETATHTIYVGSPGGLISASRVGLKTISISQRALSIGNAHNSAYVTEAIRWERFMTGKGSKSDEEILGMYRRAKVLAARNGVTVF